MKPAPNTKATGAQAMEEAMRAALDFAAAAHASLEAQRSDQGISASAYRKHIRAMRAVLWCGMNDVGRAKRIAVRQRRQKHG
ncbi:hypothetical protein [Pseudacidovorax sp. RU35E]|uniref:hypothetical protein n=1 Tax=Pseudacidovorax sp. RU35E TaxID=1907403 RepID=UPI00117AAED7|nr:hypothetical protein [Pseudacidovorax sp. RU35E]